MHIELARTTPAIVEVERPETADRRRRASGDLQQNSLELVIRVAD